MHIEPEGEVPGADGEGPPEPQNRLLASLSRSELRQLSPHLMDVTLAAGQVLHEPGQPLEYVYFPCGAVISLSAVMSDGTWVQTAMIGREGMVGCATGAGATRSPGGALCTVGGRVKRLPVRELIALQARVPALRRLMAHQIGVLTIQLNQIAACNGVHSIEQRFVRCLLMIADGVGADSFRQTQERLASMLGVRRASISQIAANLRRKRLIRYSRGRLVLLDREGLAAIACECYGIIRDASERLPD